MTETEHERRRRLAYAEWWTPAEAALMLDVDKRTITRWIAAGMPHEAGVDHRRRKRLRVRRTVVHEWGADPTRRTRRRRDQD